MEKKMKNKKGATVVEFIVVIMIIGTLCALLVPAVQKARELAITTQAEKKAVEKFYTVTLIKPDGAIHKTFTVSSKEELFTTFKDGGMILCKKAKMKQDGEPIIAVASGWMIDFKMNVEQ